MSGAAHFACGLGAVASLALAFFMGAAPDDSFAAAAIARMIVLVAGIVGAIALVTIGLGAH